MLVLLAGLPGSGKSTLLASIVASIPGAVVRAMTFLPANDSRMRNTGASWMRIPWALPQAFDIDDAMPEAFRERMAAGLPITDEQRRELMAKVHRDLAGLVAANPGQTVVAGLVLVAQAHRESLLALAPGARLVVLEAPLSVLTERVAARGGHFFNPRAIEALHARLEPVTCNHVLVDASKGPGEVLRSVLDAMGVC
jgi:gluconate kinase